MFEVLFDKRLSLRFRILNLLSGDYLRNYLAVRVELPLWSAIYVLDGPQPDEAKVKLLNHYIRKAKRGLDDVFQL